MNLIKSDEGMKEVTIDVFDNHVYFYSDVSETSVLDLVKKLREVDNRLRSESATREVEHRTPIWLHIQSGGGMLFAGFSAADQIARITTPIYSIVEGFAASAATLVSLSCQKRYIQPNAFMMIHQLTGFAWGKYEEVQDTVKLMDMAMERIIKFYVEKTGMKRKEVQKLLKRDSWFDAEGCIERGLVDEILK